MDAFNDQIRQNLQHRKKMLITVLFPNTNANRYIPLPSPYFFCYAVYDNNRFHASTEANKVILLYFQLSFSPGNIFVIYMYKNQ